MVLMIVAIGGLSGCGGSSSHKSSSHKPAVPKSHVCQAAWHCGHPFGTNKLLSTFDVWPEVRAVYRNGNSFVVYTSLSANSYGRAVDICDTVFEDLMGINVRSPDIVVLSTGGPTDSVQLASGATPGTGCTGLAP